MSARRLLLIDADPDFRRILDQQLGPYGFEIHTAEANIDSLGHVRELLPEIIFIAVEEPDKVGYSLCNKAKKGVAKSIPVVLTTRSVPTKGFNSHRKLKVHADEYIDKRTTSPDEVLGKIDGLVGVGERQSMNDFDIPMEVEEISIDDIEIEEELAAEELNENDRETAVHEIADAVGEFNEDDDKTFMGPPQIFSENIEEEADAAFAALTDDASQEITAQSPIDNSDDATAVVEVQQVEDNATAVVEVQQVEDNQQEVAVEATPEPASDGIDLGLGLDKVAEMATEEQSGIHDRRVLQKVTTLERENERLKAALEQANSDDSDQSYAREREFLKMREQINSKEKEILDLRDELGGKDRQILDIQEKVRQLEHAKAAFDSKNLELETKLLEHDERLTALKAKQTKSAQHEKELVSELESTRRQLQDATKKFEADAEAAASLLNNERSSHEKSIQSLKEDHEKALTNLQTQHETAAQEQAHNHETAIDSLQKEHRQQLEQQEKQLHQQHSEQLEEIHQQHRDKLNATTKELEQTHADATAKLEEQHGHALEQLRTQQEQQQQALKEESEASKRQLETQHADQLEKVASEHEAAQQMLRDQHAGQLSRIEGEGKNALEKAIEQGQANLEQAVAKERETLTTEHTDKVRLLTEQFDSEKSDIQQQKDALQSQLDDARNTIHNNEEELAKTQQQVNDLKQELENMTEQANEHRAHAANNLETLKANEDSVDRAKKALAIALTILEDTTSNTDTHRPAES